MLAVVALVVIAAGVLAGPTVAKVAKSTVILSKGRVVVGIPEMGGGIP